MKNKRKTTKRLLQLDLYIQISLIVLTIIQIFFPYTQWNSFIIFYFGLGGVQLLSYILHFPRRIKRGEISKTYSYILVGIIVFGLLGLFIKGSLFILLFTMLFLGVFMALYYLVHTYNNLKMYQDEK